MKERKYLFSYNQYEYYSYNDKFIRKSKKKTETISTQFFLQICEIVGFEYQDDIKD